MDCSWVLHLKTPHQTQSHLTSVLCHLLAALYSALYTQVYELISRKVQGLCLHTIFCIWYPVVPATVSEKASLFLLNFFVSLSNCSWLVCVHLFLGFLFCSLDLCSYLSPIPCCTDHYSFIVLKMGISTLQLFFSCSIVLAILWVLPFHINFKISLSICTK